MKNVVKVFLLFLAIFVIHSIFLRNDGFCTNHPFGDFLIDGGIGDATSLIPMLATDAPSHSICSLIYNGLVKYNEKLQIVGDLASSFEVSKDGKEITFHLRKGVFWHDGKEFSAKDVIYGYKMITDPNVPSPYASDYKEVKKIFAPDKYTVKVIYKEPFAPALSTWGYLVVLPSHLLSGKDITKSKLIRHPIGTGPFIFKRWDVGQKIILLANKNYFLKRPYLSGYIYRIIPDQATLFLELKSLNIDLANLTPLQFKRQTDSKFFRKNFKKYIIPSMSYTYLGYNLKHPFFKDKRVRQAISYAIDKNEIIKGVLFGYGQVSKGPYPPKSPYFNPHVKTYPYNPKKAKELLRDAGFRDKDGDGVLEKNGKPFRFTILVNQGNLQRLKAAEIIQRRLSKIGIEVKIRVIEWASLISYFIEKRVFDAVILGWSLGIDPDQYAIWSSDEAKAGGLNFISYKNKEVDRLLVLGRRTIDVKKRKRIYFKLQEIIAEDQPYTFLYVPYDLVILHKRFFGVKVSPLGITYNIEKWYVPKNLQMRNYILP